MAFKMKGSTHYGKGNSAVKAYGKPSPTKNYKNPQDYKVFNMGNEPSAVKNYSVDKGSHDHPHGDSPNKFLGGMLKKLGGAAKGMLKGKDGKFGIGDVGRLAMGPLGAAAGATGLFAKEEEMKKDKVKEKVHSMHGQVNDKKTKIVDKKGNWRPLTEKDRINMKNKKK